MKRKLLYITNIPTPYKDLYFRELAREYDLTVLYERASAGNRDKSWKFTDRNLGYTEIVLPSMKWGQELGVAFGVLKYLKNIEGGVLVGGYGSPTAIIAALYLKRKHIKFGMVCDGMLPQTEHLFKKMIKSRLLSNPDFFVCSGKTTERCIERYRGSGKGIHIYPFSSVSEQSIENINLEGKEERKRAIGCAGKRMILYVGRFLKGKGIDVLIDAFGDMGEDCELYLVGKSENSDIDVSGNERIHIYEFLQWEQLKKFYLAADVFALPTRWDVWGLVVNEAMSFGLPVVSTNKCGAALEMIRDGWNGRIVPAEDVDLLADAIRDVVLYGESKNMYLNAYHTAQEYTIERMAERTMEILNEEYR